MNHCGINDESAKSIFETLEINESLQELNLQHNDLTEQGYLAMVSSMRNWKSLRWLRVEGGAGLWACRAELAEGMRLNQSLHNLSLGSFDLGPYNPLIRSHVRRFLKRNRRLEKIRKLVASPKFPDTEKEGHASPASTTLPGALWPYILKCSSTIPGDTVESSETYQLVRQNVAGVLGHSWAMSIPSSSQRLAR